jgi:hypothetical protein
MGAEERAVVASDIDANFVPRRRDDVASVELDGETVLAVGDLAAEAFQTHCLNTTGTIVWECLDGTGSIEAIGRDLAEAFETDVTVVTQGVLELVRQLGAEGLLQGVKPE